MILRIGDNECKLISEKFKNLNEYVDRMVAEFWPDWNELIPKHEAKEQDGKAVKEKTEEKIAENGETELAGQ